MRPCAGVSTGDSYFKLWRPGSRGGCPRALRLVWGTQVGWAVGTAGLVLRTVAAAVGWPRAQLPPSVLLGAGWGLQDLREGTDLLLQFWNFVLQSWVLTAPRLRYALRLAFFTCSPRSR